MDDIARKCNKYYISINSIKIINILRWIFGWIGVVLGIGPRTQAGTPERVVGGISGGEIRRSFVVVGDTRFVIILEVLKNKII